MHRQPCHIKSTARFAMKTLLHKSDFLRLFDLVLSKLTYAILLNINIAVILSLLSLNKAFFVCSNFSVRHARPF